MPSSKLRHIPVHMILIFVSCTTIFPFYWMLCTSIKPDDTIANLSFFPTAFDFSHYSFVFFNSNMLQAFINSIIITVCAVFGTLLTCSMSAYAFEKISFKGKKFLFAAIISTMMIPQMVILIPQYIVFSFLNWTNTFLPLIVPTMLVNAYGIFLLKSFMAGMPDSYLESAKIDGASQPRIYWSIVLPLSKPSLMALALISVIANWNNFLPQLIYLNDEHLFTVPMIINTFRDAYSTQYGNLMAASAISVLPIVLVYLFAQKFFIEGIALTGLKA